MQSDLKNNHTVFELRRLSDDLIYVFDRHLSDDGKVGYQRRDQDLWITYHPPFGWVAYDDQTNSIMGRPWNILPADQKPDYPPASEWVSKKGIKSYVYELIYIS